MNEQTKEKIMKVLIVIGVILGMLGLYFSTAIDLFSETKADIRKNELALDVITILGLADIILIFFSISKPKK